VVLWTLADLCAADLMFLALQIILALGNRPKAERLTYTISISVYAFFSLYLIVMTVILTIKACVLLLHSQDWIVSLTGHLLPRRFCVRLFYPRLLIMLSSAFELTRFPPNV
jgi:hypothetical protein